MQTHRAHYLEGKAARRNCIHRTVKAGMAEPRGTDIYTETRNASLSKEALPNIRSVSFKLAS